MVEKIESLRLIPIFHSSIYLQKKARLGSLRKHSGDRESESRWWRRWKSLRLILTFSSLTYLQRRTQEKSTVEQVESFGGGGGGGGCCCYDPFINLRLSTYNQNARIRKPKKVDGHTKGFERLEKSKWSFGVSLTRIFHFSCTVSTAES